MSRRWNGVEDFGLDVSLISVNAETSITGRSPLSKYLLLILNSMVRPSLNSQHTLTYGMFDTKRRCMHIQVI